VVFYAGGSEPLVQKWLGKELNYRLLPSLDTVSCMNTIFAEAFKAGKERVVIVSADCPDLNAEIMEKAFAALEENDLVLGPTKDGGYYLLGLKKYAPDLFKGILWDTDKVLKQTVKIAKDLGLQAAFLNILTKVEQPEDLYVWEKYCQGRALNVTTPYLSIIIPAHNDEAVILRTLESIPKEKSLEIIVVDGSSSDATAAKACAFGAKVIRSSAGRALQMNAGAAAAKGKVLLFLHANTQLPPGFFEIVQQDSSQPDIAAGAFLLQLESPDPKMKLIELLANWRSRFRKLPYGNQAIFLRAELFHEVGGFSLFPIMEDIDLIRRLKRRGRIVIAPISVITYVEGWGEKFWKTFGLNLLAQTLYFLGFSPPRIARLLHKTSF